jgi:RNA polymerase sigma-70 factor, ECF subfamily
MPERKKREISLAGRAMIGDPDAFSELAESIGARLARYSRLVCRQREDAEEVVQETLLQVFQKIGDLREPQGVHSWVFRIALNQCRMMRRRGVFEPDEVASLEGEPATEQLLAETGQSPEELVLAGESSHALEEALLSLPEAYREVLMLRYLEGLSTDETAGALETSAEVIRTRLHRARLALRRKLQG